MGHFHFTDETKFWQMMNHGFVQSEQQKIKKIYFQFLVLHCRSKPVEHTKRTKRASQPSHQRQNLETLNQKNIEVAAETSGDNIDTDNINETLNRHEKEGNYYHKLTILPIFSHNLWFNYRMFCVCEAVRTNKSRGRNSASTADSDKLNNLWL